MLREYSLVTILVLPIVLPFCYANIRYGASKKALLKVENKRSSNTIGIALTALFFLNCSMPYLGLKSAQTINMFANIRLESGLSNHLIMRKAPGPFGYLDDVAIITEQEGAPGLATYMNDGYAIVYYDLLAYALEYPSALISYTRGGVNYTNMNAESLADDIENILHPEWFRKWFHFQIVDLNRPVECGYR